MNELELKTAIKKTNGLIFCVKFVKKDGTVRSMIARTGVKKGVKGTGKPLAEDSTVLRIFDMQKKEFRSFDCARVLYVKCGAFIYNAESLLLPYTCPDCGTVHTKRTYDIDRYNPNDPDILCYDCFTKPAYRKAA